MEKELKFDLVLFQYINEANRVMIAPLETLKNSSPVSQYSNSQFFVEFNYARHLRLGHRLRRQTFWLSVESVHKTFKNNFLIISIVVVVITLASFTCISPLVLKVHNSLTKVNSLFGFLSKQQISSLAKRCDFFRESFLVESISLTSDGFSSKVNANQQAESSD